MQLKFTLISVKYAAEAVTEKHEAQNTKTLLCVHEGKRPPRRHFLRLELKGTQTNMQVIKRLLAASYCVALGTPEHEAGKFAQEARFASAARNKDVPAAQQ